MANGISTGDLRGFNKGRSSKFREGSNNVMEITITIKMKTIVRKPLMILLFLIEKSKFK